MPVENTPYAIDVRDLSFSYGGGVPALEHITFSVPEGEYVGILGPNGGGKSTLLKVLLGLLPPTSGDVVIADGPMSYVPQRAAQADGQFPATVAEVVASGTLMTKSPGNAVKEAMANTGIADLANRSVGSLSGGQRQRVYLARALAARPRILMLDEPTGGVDVEAQERFYELLRSLNKNTGLTILFASHDLDVITREAKMILCINHRLVSHGTPEDMVHSGALLHLYDHQGGYDHDHTHA
jgi:zinc transport system ATP-binding protein